MDPNLLFLRRVRQLTLLVESNEEVELVDIASILRQLLFDKNSLADAVNMGPPLEFEVGPGLDPGIASIPELAFFGTADGIDPQTSRTGKSVTLTRSQFGQHPVTLSKGELISIKKIVKYNANKKGGQHWDPGTVPSDAKLRALDSLYLGNVPATTRDLKAIGRVALRALDPLVQSILSRGA